MSIHFVSVSNCHDVPSKTLTVYGVSIDLCCQVVHACHRKTRKVNLCTEFCQVYRVVVVVAGCLSGYCHVTTNRLSGLSRMAVISVAVR